MNNLKTLIIFYVLFSIPSLCFSEPKKPWEVFKNTDHLSKTGTSKIRGGKVIKGYPGVIQINSSGSSCTGNIIASNAVLTAAHCLGNVGVASSFQGTGTFVINYFDSVSGKREIYRGEADWYVPQSFRYDGNINKTGWVNSDIAVIKTRKILKDTNTSDYLVIYDDNGSHLKPTLKAYGAGIYTYSGKNDGELRVNWFSVEHVKKNHIIIDTRKKDGICKGDSGGPLIYVSPNSKPMVAGVASIIELFGLEEKVCTNNDWGIDDAKYSRANWEKLEPLMKQAKVRCTHHKSAGVGYRKCYVGGASPTQKVEFECRTESSNQPCKKNIACPSGMSIITGKAACNLEYGAVSNNALNQTKSGNIRVIRESDKTKDGICSIGKTEIRKGSLPFTGVTGKNSTTILCKEHDKNGGDCHIRVSLTCGR